MGNLTSYLSYSHEMEGPLANDQPIHTTTVEFNGVRCGVGRDTSTGAAKLQAAQQALEYFARNGVERLLSP